MTTGRRKIVLQEVIDKIQDIHATRDPALARDMDLELKELVLTGIKNGDFQGLTAKIAAKLALNHNEMFS